MYLTEKPERCWYPPAKAAFRQQPPDDRAASTGFWAGNNCAATSRRTWLHAERIEDTCS